MPCSHMLYAHYRPRWCPLGRLKHPQSHQGLKELSLARLAEYVHGSGCFWQHAAHPHATHLVCNSLPCEYLCCMVESCCGGEVVLVCGTAAGVWQRIAPDARSALAKRGISDTEWTADNTCIKGLRSQGSCWPILYRSLCRRLSLRLWHLYLVVAYRLVG